MHVHCQNIGVSVNAWQQMGNRGVCANLQLRLAYLFLLLEYPGFATMSTSYSFPTMSIPALSAAIQEIWELNVTGQQLSRPDQQFVTLLYSRAVEYCLGITPQDVEDAHARVQSNSGERDVRILPIGADGRAAANARAPPQDIAANTLDLTILFRTLCAAL